jgi:diguanylate cyclase (GGDEF)-like protein
VKIGVGFRRAWSELRNFGDWRLSTKVVVGFMVLALAAIFVLAKLSEATTTQKVTSIESHQLSDEAGSLALQVDSQVTQYHRDALAVVTDPDTVSYMEMSAVDQASGVSALLAHIEPALKADPEYRELLILDPGGRVVVSSGGSSKPGDNLSGRDFYTRGLTATRAEPYLSDIVLAPDGSSQVVYTSLPIRDAPGRILGVVAVQVSAVQITAPLSSKDLISQHRNGFLVSQDGVILTNSADPALNYRSVGSLDPAHAAAVEKLYGLDSVRSLGLDDLALAIAGSHGGVATAKLLNSRETDVIGFAPLSNQPWTVLVAENQAIFTADVSDLARTQFFNAFLLALIIGGLVVFVGRAFDTTERESLSDPLTGLANRRFLQEILLRELRRAQRSNQPVSLVIMDIDHFKAVNDTFGHNAGDEMLEQIAGIMISGVRATDFVVRYGGEEFVILLPETRVTDAQQVAEKLRKTVGETVMESTSKPGLTFGCTVSAGVSTYPMDASSGEALILKADKALYYAKQHGRNQVITVAEAEAPHQDPAVASIQG